MTDHCPEIALYREGACVVAESRDIDVASYGRTEIDALANLEAVKLYFDDDSGRTSGGR